MGQSSSHINSSDPRFDKVGRFTISSISSILSSSNGQVTNLRESLKNEGFAIIDLGASDADARVLLNQLQEITLHFFAENKDVKCKHEDPKSENLGYVKIGEVREYLKLRRSGDRLNEWPSISTPSTSSLQETDRKTINNNSTEDIILKDCFLKAFDFFEDISFKILLHLRSDPECDGLLKDAELEDVKMALKERASVGISHYYKQDVKSSEISENSLVDVCSSHRDTGIMTFIVASQTPGLQIWDRKEKKWIEIEKLLKEKEAGNTNNNNVNSGSHYLLAIMGEKIQMFSGVSSLIPTDHQVMIPPGIERYSMLYFMDVAK